MYTLREMFAMYNHLFCWYVILIIITFLLFYLKIVLIKIF